MSNAMSIARPYTRAAFAVAKANGDLSEWARALAHLAFTVNNSQVQALIFDPTVSKKVLSEFFTGFLHDVCGNGSSVRQEKIANFMQLLAVNKRLLALPEISALFQEFLAKEEGYVQLTVTSAFGLDKKKQASIKEVLAERLKSNVVLDFEDDPDLIGGLSVRAGNWVLDGTIEDKVRRLKSQLISAGA